MVKSAQNQPQYEAHIKNHLGSTVKVYNTNLNTEVYSTDYDPYGALRLETVATATPVTAISGRGSMIRI